MVVYKRFARLEEMIAVIAIYSAVGLALALTVRLLTTVAG